MVHPLIFLLAHLRGLMRRVSIGETIDYEAEFGG